MSHPGWAETRINFVELTHPEFRVVARDINVSYTFAGLASSSAESIKVVELALYINIAPTGTEPETMSGTFPDSFAPVFSFLPAKQIEIQRLTVEAVDPEVYVVGTAKLSAQSAVVDLTAAAPGPWQGWSTRLRLNDDNSFDFRLNSTRLVGPPPVSIRGQIAEQQLGAQVCVHIESEDLLPAQNYFPQLPDQVKLASTGGITLPWPLPEDASLDPQSIWPFLSADLDSLLLTYASKGPDVEARFSSDNLLLSSGLLTATLSGEIEHTRGDLKIRTQLPANTPLTYDNGVLHLGTQARPLLQTVRSNDAEIEMRSSLTLNLNATPELAIAAELGAQSGKELGLQGVINGNFQALDLQSAALQGSLLLDASASIGTYSIPHKLAANLTYSRDTHLQIDGSFAAEPIRLPFQVTHNLDTAEGELVSSGTHAWHGDLIASVLPGWDGDIELTEGKMSTLATIAWGDSVSTDLSLQLSGANASFDEYVLNGVELQTRFTNHDATNPETWSLAPTSIKAAALNVGFEISNISAELSSTTDGFNIHDARADLLGGTILLEEASYQWQEASSFDVQLQDIDLAKLLALEGDKVSGSGTLSGSLPITANASGISVTQGFVAAAAPGGKLSLSPDLTQPTGRAELDFALKALEDFTYTDLRADINYGANGDLKLAVKLAGTNPGFENGRPVHYNLTVQENIPVLLQSLRIQQGLTDKIERAVTK